MLLYAKVSMFLCLLHSFMLDCSANVAHCVVFHILELVLWR